MKELICIKEDIRQALKSEAAVIALESSIIAHGMPYPSNIETALAVERIAREMGVAPATVGILAGKLRVGLTEAEIERLGSEQGILKVSRKDLSYALAMGVPGATTVCGTMIAAHLAGIEVLATGGIGGVHREAEKSFDISSDMIELSRTPLIVVSAGAKAILDLAKTLEFLETQGIPVIGFGTQEFPGFYSRASGLRVALRAESASEIARLFAVHKALKLPSGLLVANPVPVEEEIPRDRVEGYLAEALKALHREQIRGKEVTPFLLSRIVELSGGEALKTNIALLKNNVRLACGIALSLKKSI